MRHHVMESHDVGLKLRVLTHEALHRIRKFFILRAEEI